MNIQIYQCNKKLTIITPLEPYRYPLSATWLFTPAGDSSTPVVSISLSIPWKSTSVMTPSSGSNWRNPEGLWKLCLQGKVFKKRRFLEEKNWNCCSNCFWLIYNFTIVIIVKKTLLKFYNSKIVNFLAGKAPVSF